MTKNLTSASFGFGNVGSYNSGGYNTGSLNYGDFNTGDYNSGERNTGNRNEGGYNTGDFNMGSYNTGWFNLSSYNCGCFCTNNNGLLFFDKPTLVTVKEWEASQACNILSQIRTVVWSQGVQKKIPFKQAANELWASLPREKRSIILNMPNFNADKFYLIMGIDSF